MAAWNICERYETTLKAQRDEWAFGEQLFSDPALRTAGALETCGILKREIKKLDS